MPTCVAEGRKTYAPASMRHASLPEDAAGLEPGRRHGEHSPFLPPLFATFCHSLIPKSSFQEDQAVFSSRLSLKYVFRIRKARPGTAWRDGCGAPRNAHENEPSPRDSNTTEATDQWAHQASFLHRDEPVQ